MYRYMHACLGISVRRYQSNSNLFHAGPAFVNHTPFNLFFWNMLSSRDMQHANHICSGDLARPPSVLAKVLPVQPIINMINMAVKPLVSTVPLNQSIGNGLLFIAPWCSHDIPPWTTVGGGRGACCIKSCTKLRSCGTRWIPLWTNSKHAKHSHCNLQKWSWQPKFHVELHW